MDSFKFSHVILDASFVSRMKRIDDSCELLDLLNESINGEKCIIERYQYDNSPCNDYSSSCELLNDLITDEEVVEIALFSDKINADLYKIYKDPVDVKIFIWTIKNRQTVVWSCDKNLLLLCKKHRLYHGCFKSAVKMIDNYLDGEISQDKDYKLHLMDNGDDPFFHYNKDTRCVTHCNCPSTSICYKKNKQKC